MKTKTKAPTKSEVYAMYPDIPKKELRRYINEIIRENRKIDKKVPVHKNTLFHKEFLLLQDIIGLPVGIEDN